MKGIKVSNSRLRLDESDPQGFIVSREDFNRNIPRAFDPKDNVDDLSAIYPINKTNNDFTKLSTTMQMGTFTKEISNISRITDPKKEQMKFDTTADVISKDQI